MNSDPFEHSCSGNTIDSLSLGHYVGVEVVGGEDGLAVVELDHPFEAGLSRSTHHHGGLDRAPIEEHFLAEPSKE